MGRIFEIETDDAQAVHIVAERITYISGAGQLITPNDLLEGYWSEEQLLAVPGGPEALARWRTGADDLYQRWNEREEAMIGAEDDYVTSLPVEQRWDQAAGEMGREIVERIWGPRPED
jgi:hypothetical protein